MCLIGIAVDWPGPWLLVVAANRDEFHDRQAAPASWWNAPDAAAGPEQATVFGGRDLQGGGTWLGLRRAAHASLRVGALTNLRPGLMPAPALPPPGRPAVPPSRGNLVAGYLSSRADPATFLRNLDPPPGAYAGFNLLAIALGGRGGGIDTGYLNNLPGSQVRRLAAGIHVLSNATLDVPWPKTRRLQAAMTAALGGVTVAVTGAAPRGATAATVAADAGNEARLATTLLAALGDRTEAGEADLPRTGLDRDRERLLSAPFIVDDHYGTRCSTVLVVDREGRVYFAERSFGPGGRLLGMVTERFVLGRPAGS
ncbi:MAG: NRDE family protein [Lautropia sp.]|nr:NRDE family protein [Lautropia sp.]